MSADVSRPTRPAQSANVGAKLEAIPLPVWMALATFGILLWPQAMLNDPDSFWHLKAGEWMITHRQVLHHDPFSFTFADKPWTTHEWLSEVIMALIYHISGWNGLMTFTAAAVAMSVFILSHFSARWLNGIGLIVLVLLGMALIGPHLLVRPHIWVLPLLCLWITKLAEARSADRPPPLWLIAVMILWANMHGSFFLGLCLIGPFALEALIDATPPERKRMIMTWGRFGIAALVAALITPHGIDGLMFPLKLIFMPGINGITEWAPSDFSELSPLEVTLLATLFVLIRFRVSVPVIRLILLLGFVHLTLKHQRHEMVLGLLGIVLLAEPIGRALAARAATALPKPRPPLSGAVQGVIAVAAGLLIAIRLYVPVPAITTEHTPVKALQAVPRELVMQPVLNDYDLGGYLIGQGVRPFIDGRTDMYGAQFLARYQAIMGQRNTALIAALKDYDIRWTLLRRGSAAESHMDALPGWHRLYDDPAFVVHARLTPPAGS